MKIILDAGHGANTSGKRSPDGTVREWNINSKIVEELMVLASKYEGVQVKRVDDPTGKRDVPLQERTDIANAWGADLYVSIHQNAMGVGWSTAKGAETFAYSKDSTEAATVAKHIQNEIVKQTGSADRGVKFQNFHVLRETKCPSVLVECGFMTNRSEAVDMLTSVWQKAKAKAIMDGIAKGYYLKLKKGATPPPVAVPTKPHIDYVHEVTIDGKVIGKYKSNQNIANIVLESLANNPELITIKIIR